MSVETPVPFCRAPGACDCPACITVDVPAPAATNDPLARLTVALPADAAVRIERDPEIVARLAEWQRQQS